MAHDTLRSRMMVGERGLGLCGKGHSTKIDDGNNMMPRKKILGSRDPVIFVTEGVGRMWDFVHDAPYCFACAA